MMYFLDNDMVGLRTVTEEDIDGSYGDWFNDADVCQYNSHHKFPMTREEISNYVREVNKGRNCLLLAVCDKTSDKHIGNISLQQIDMINRQTEIAFVIGDKDYWNKGYATMAARLLIDHAFKELNMNRIYFGTADNNIGMQRLGEKLKFHRGGVKRQAIYKNGKYYDVFEYDLLREEWILEMV